jgi:hypothetical protein
MTDAVSGRERNTTHKAGAEPGTTAQQRLCQFHRLANIYRSYTRRHTPSKLSSSEESCQPSHELPSDRNDDIHQLTQNKSLY